MAGGLARRGDGRVHRGVTRPLIGQSLVAVGAEMIAAVGVYAITFLTFGISAAERRFYLSKVLEFTTHARLAVPTVSESA